MSRHVPGRTVVGLALAVALTACPGGGATDDPTPPRGAPAPTTDPPTGIVRVQGCEPASLFPADMRTDCGHQVGQGLYRQLVELDPRDSAPRWGTATDHAVAAAVTSTDAQTWRIQVEDGWTFHDGTPVTAASFVDAWNFAAHGPNAQAGAHLFRPIEGFAAMHCPDPGCDPDASRLRGLRLVDEMTFEVELVVPDRTFLRRLAHVAFSPLPPAALEDPEGWGEAPTGNGPLRIEGAWEHDQRIALRAYPEYPGPPARAAGVDLLLYTREQDPWQDLAEARIDLATTVPPAADLERPVRVVERTGSQVEVLVAPSYRAELSDPRLVRALSQAIDRDAIIADQFGGRARPARGVVPPVVADDRDRCGAPCRFDPARARELLAESGLPDGGIEIWFDRDANQAAWVQAIASQWREHLRLDPGQVRVRALPHAAWVSHVTDRRVGGLYPLGWRMDVASAAEYLDALHAPTGLFNFDGHTNPGVVEGLDRAARADTDAAARSILEEVEQAVLADLHHVPLWTRTHVAAHTDRVGDVRLDGQGLVQLERLVVRG